VAFNRHRGDPAMAEGDAQRPFWRVVRDRRVQQNYMLEILPPLWMRADTSQCANS
jgi:hypothetical protein